MSGHDRNNNQCIICNVTNNAVIYVTILPRAFLPWQDHNKNQCVFCNVILGQVTLWSISHPGCPGCHYKFNLRTLRVKDEHQLVLRENWSEVCTMPLVCCTEE
jgi:hypothetical protein